MARWYQVFIIKSTLSIQDPDLPSPRYHTVIFVETHSDGARSGVKHHVTGDVTTGMSYVSEPTRDPSETEMFHSGHFIGYIDITSYPHAMDCCLKQIPPPPRQKAYNITTGRTEPFKTADPLTFYAPGESKTPLIKCTEWTEQQAIPALLKQGIIVQNI